MLKFLRYLIIVWCAVTPIRKEVIISFWMEVTAHWMGQNIPERCQEMKKTFVVQIKVPDSINIHVSTFPEKFNFQ